MDVSGIVAEIDAQLRKLQEARTILVGLGSAPEVVSDKPRRGRPKGSVNAPKKASAAKKGKRNMSPEGRKRIAEAMKRRWAERRTAGAGGAAKKDAAKK